MESSKFAEDYAVFFGAFGPSKGAGVAGAATRVRNFAGEMLQRTKNLLIWQQCNVLEELALEVVYDQNNRAAEMWGNFRYGIAFCPGGMGDWPERSG